MRWQGGIWETIVKILNLSQLECRISGIPPSSRFLVVRDESQSRIQYLRNDSGKVEILRKQHLGYSRWQFEVSFFNDLRCDSLSLASSKLVIFRVTLLNLGETYTVNLPYANCKGIIIGAMTMELGGTVSHFSISFYFFQNYWNFRWTSNAKRRVTRRLWSFFWNRCWADPWIRQTFISAANAINFGFQVKGSIRLGSQELSEISGHWDEQVTIKQIKEARNLLTKDSFMKFLTFIFPASFYEYLYAYQRWTKFWF